MTTSTAPTISSAERAPAHRSALPASVATAVRTGTVRAMRGDLVSGTGESSAPRGSLAQAAIDATPVAFVITDPSRSRGRPWSPPV